MTETKEKMSKALDRLSELSNQVEQACDFYIYVTPRLLYDKVYISPCIMDEINCETRSTDG